MVFIIPQRYRLTSTCVCGVLLCLRNIQLSLSNLKKNMQKASLSSLPQTKDEDV